MPRLGINLFLNLVFAQFTKWCAQNSGPFGLASRAKMRGHREEQVINYPRPRVSFAQCASGKFGQMLSGFGLPGEI